MARYKIALSALALLAVIGGLLAYRWVHTASAQTDPSELLNASFSDVDGQPYALNQWQGDVLVLNFWATWCPPCRQEIPEFIELQRALGDKGLQFVGIAIDEAGAVKDYIAAVGINYPILIGEEEGNALAGRLGNYFNALPFSAVFDRNGQLVHTHPGLFSKEQIAEVIKPLLAGASDENSP